MSQENVELVRSFLPDPEVDLVALFKDDPASGPLADVSGGLLDPAFACAFHYPATQPTTYSGLSGLRDGFLDWLAPWANYRTEIERLIDAGDRVVLLFRDYARREPGAPEVVLIGATIFALRGGRIVRIDFYAGDRAKALASVGLAE
jgi:hypothetical protein